MTGRFEKFTPQAREAIRLAEEAARTLNHGSVGTEHLLLGLLEEGTGVAFRVLSECGVEKGKVEELMQELISGSNALKTRSEMWTPGRSGCWRTATTRRCGLRRRWWARSTFSSP